MQIIPSIFVSSEKEFIQQVTAVAGEAAMVQIDIADGEFVPAKTWADPDVAQENLPIDCELHLMVKHPLEEIKKWSEVTRVKRVLFHAECDDDIAQVIKTIHNYGWQASLVLNPETPTTVAEPFVNDLNGVMFMGIHPGKQGQSLIPGILEKMATFKLRYPRLYVELDGGVNEETLPEIVQTNIDAVCPGSAVFRNDRPPAENINKLKEYV